MPRKARTPIQRAPAPQPPAATGWRAMPGNGYPGNRSLPPLPSAFRPTAPNAVDLSQAKNQFATPLPSNQVSNAPLSPGAFLPPPGPPAPLPSTALNKGLGTIPGPSQTPAPVGGQAVPLGGAGLQVALPGQATPGMSAPPPIPAGMGQPPPPSPSGATPPGLPASGGGPQSYLGK